MRSGRARWPAAPGVRDLHLGVDRAPQGRRGLPRAAWRITLAWCRRAYPEVRADAACCTRRRRSTLAVTGLFGAAGRRRAGAWWRRAGRGPARGCWASRRLTFLQGSRPSHLPLLEALRGAARRLRQLMVGGEALRGARWCAVAPAASGRGGGQPLRADRDHRGLHRLPGSVPATGAAGALVPIGRPIWQHPGVRPGRRLRPVPAGVAGRAVPGRARSWPAATWAGPG